MTRTVAITGVGRRDRKRDGGCLPHERLERGRNGCARRSATTSRLTIISRSTWAEANVDEQLGRFFASLPSLEALVNNAAIGRSTMALETTRIVGRDDGCECARRLSRDEGGVSVLEASGGAVINIASVHAVATSPFAAAYAASKGAMVALTRATAIEWAPRVRVNAVLPGAIDTPCSGRASVVGLLTVTSRMPLAHWHAALR